MLIECDKNGVRGCCVVGKGDVLMFRELREVIRKEM